MRWGDGGRRGGKEKDEEEEKVKLRENNETNEGTKMHEIKK